MANVSIGLSQYLIVDILIINVRVSSKISRCANYTDKFHHGISANILTRKWGIDLDKAKLTLQSATHENVRSRIKPITQGYRIYLLS